MFTARSPAHHLSGSVALTQPGGRAIDTKVYAEAPAGSIADGIKDITAGLKRRPVWWTLTWYGIRSQYRRTYLGPWWITVQQVIFVAGLSLLFGLLLNQDLQTFVPYVTVGFIAFTWMTGMIQGGATTITTNGAAIKTSPGPLSIYALKNFAGNTIQFGHDFVVIIAVIIIFQVHVTWSLVLVPVAVAMIALNGIAVGLWLGPLVARYRDVGQIVTSIIRVLFFFTPIFWVATDLTNKQLVWLAGWNPLAYLLDFLRAPLLGQTPTAAVVIGSVAFTATNVLIALVHFGHTRDRLAYWL
jgi:ABC-type polysaccharide/polyol phosphate export permease